MNKKQTAAIKANASIKASSLKLVQDDRYSAVFYLTFVFDSEVENFVTVYFMTRELVDKKTKQIVGFEADGKQPTKTNKFPKGQTLAYGYGISYIDTSHYE